MEAKRANLTTLRLVPMKEDPKKPSEGDLWYLVNGSEPELRVFIGGKIRTIALK
jgi:hypothetical protein